MSNIVYEDKLFNEERKNLFLEQYKEGTKKTLVRMFKVSQQMEYDLNKDVCEFSKEELRMLLYLYNPTTDYSSKANVTWLQRYISWAIENGYVTGLNPLADVNVEWKTQFVIKAKKKFWTNVEIKKIIDKQVNFQDGCIVSLLFNGVRGSQNYEISSLRAKDVHRETSSLTVWDEDGTSREVVVDDECIKQCVGAISESTYEKMNGMSFTVKSPTSKLVDNEYVIRNAIMRTINFDKVDKFTILRRISKIADEIGEKITPTAIFNSGMLFMLKELYVANGKVGEEEYEAVFQHFNIQGEQSRYRILKEFLNLETVKKIYGLD